MHCVSHMTCVPPRMRTCTTIKFRKSSLEMTALEMSSLEIIALETSCLEISTLKMTKSRVRNGPSRPTYFSENQFSYYSLYPNLEGIKDALSYKFRRLMIGQNCAVCTNKVARTRGHRDAFSSSGERRKRPAFRQACLAGH